MITIREKYDPEILFRKVFFLLFNFCNLRYYILSIIYVFQFNSPIIIGSHHFYFYFFIFFISYIFELSPDVNLKLLISFFEKIISI